MKKQRMEEELAKANGYYGLYWGSNGVGPKLFGNCKESPLIRCFIASHLNSHDAMQPLIGGLTDDEIDAYDMELTSIVMRDGVIRSTRSRLLSLKHNATAEQMAEAYLKAKGTWEAGE